jgi:hypothetical protein
MKVALRPRGTKVKWRMGFPYQLIMKDFLETCLVVMWVGRDAIFIEQAPYVARDNHVTTTVGTNETVLCDNMDAVSNIIVGMESLGEYFLMNTEDSYFRVYHNAG